MKKLCVTELLGPRQLERSRRVRGEEQERFLGRLLEKSRKSEDVDVGSEVMKLTNNSTCRMVMSIRCSEEDCEAEKIRELVMGSFWLGAKMALAHAFGPLKKLGFWVFGKEVVDANRRYDELLEKILKEHEERATMEGFNRNDKDLMDILLDISQDSSVEFKITRKHIKAFFLDLFIGGTDTSAQATQWAMAELINHPGEFKKVRQEIESVTGRRRLVEESDLPSLPYLQAVLKETLRLHPPGPIVPRVCLQRCKVAGFDIPENTAVFVNAYAIMRDPDSWDHPDEFRPERFLVSAKYPDGSDHESKGSSQSMNFLPFGAGRRGCPGGNLAFIFMSTAVATMVQCFDWRVNGDGGEAKVNMEAGGGMSLSMAHPLSTTPVLHFNPFDL